MPKKVVKFIDLFSGMGGIRIGFEQTLKKTGYNTKCVLTSEIKEAAIKTHELNFPGEVLEGDVTKIATLAGKNMNYYKGGRGIPAPLLVRRFMGKSSAEELVDEILMLTKMNWNSGDGLYKILPVTLDFVKTLSRVAKQDLVVYDRPYDFRYFM